MAVTTHVAQRDKSQSPYQLDPDQTLRASQALLKHVKAEVKRLEKSNTTRNLLKESEDDEENDAEPIWLTIATKKHIVDKTRLKPSKIPVPHSLRRSDDLSICLITADPQRAVKNTVAEATFPSSLSQRITRIIGLTKLLARYKTFEQRRQLLSDHDIFLADERIAPRLPKALGKVFYKGTAKRPIPINLAPKKSTGEKEQPPHKKKLPKEERVSAVGSPVFVAKEIEKALSSVPVSLSPGRNVSVRVGLASFSPDELAENVSVVAPAIIQKHVTEGFKNVTGIHIKSPTSFAVPIWLSNEVWSDDSKVLPTADDRADNVNELEETDQAGRSERKRKRNPSPQRVPQAEQRKKVRLAESKATERKQTQARKDSLTAQKARLLQTET